MRNARVVEALLTCIAALLLSSSILNPTVASGGGEVVHRRQLHQPLFPVDSPPSQPPPPDQPFFQETPNQPPPPTDQIAPPPANATASAALPSATQPATKPAKKLAIAVSVGIVTLGMLSALAFFLYRHRAKRPAESQQKLVRRNSSAAAAAAADELRPPPSNLLYIGTMEPPTPPPVRDSYAVHVGDENGATSSPYHRLNSVKNLGVDRYRPSPELHPLPPLPKHALARGNSPSSMSDEDGQEATTHFTPSVVSSWNGNDDGFYTPVSRHSYRSNASSGIAPRTSVPHSKRTSPKSRLSASHDTKRESMPAPAPPPPPPPPQHEQPSVPFFRRAKFSAPPPPPNLAILRSINNQSPEVAPPQPPPPPPPPAAASVALSTPRKWEGSESSLPSSAKTVGAGEELSKSRGSPEPPEDGEGGLKPKLKPLHWDKVRATSDRATVWDQLKSSSFQLNEDMMESLFGCNSKTQVKKEAIRKPVMPVIPQENRVLDPKKSQNIAILLRALNVTRDEVTEALLDDSPDGLGSEFLETLVKMAPTKEEEIKLRDYNGDILKLGSAERFLKAVLDIPFAFKRVDAMLYRTSFDTEVKYLRKSYQTLEAASEELKNSRLFLKLLEAVLRAGNRMNVGTNRGEATSFKLDTLLKLVDIKGTDGKTTLLHFVVQEIIRSEGRAPDPPDEKNVRSQTHAADDFKKHGLQVVAGLSIELGDVKKAAGMDSAVLNGYVSKLETGLEKVRLVLQYELPNMEGKFFDSMKVFLKEAEEEIVKVKTYERKALFHVKDVTQYFHGDAAKEEAHPLRIFMIVRDFLNILDHVCKEVGRMQDGGPLVGSARSFRISATASMPVLNRFNVQARPDESSDEESLSS